ncbi:MAG: hypothetical protein ABFD54_03450 [Armatimonadota bacterium]
MSVIPRVRLRRAVNGSGQTRLTERSAPATEVTATKAQSPPAWTEKAVGEGRLCAVVAANLFASGYTQYRLVAKTR